MCPFEIFEISVGPAILGMSPLPGLTGDFLADVEKIFNWNPTTILTLTPKKEMEDLGASDFVSMIAKERIPWVHFPIKDFSIVDQQQEVLWEKISKNIILQINDGNRILVHCRGGCGRTGMIVLRFLIQFGEDPEKALERLRVIRPCAIETLAQENWAKFFNTSVN